MSALTDMIKSARGRDASDLHLVSGMPPILRVNGEILSLPGYDQLAPGSIPRLLEPITDEPIRQTFQEQWKVCFSRCLPQLGYFRVSLYKRAGAMEASIRLGIMRIPSFEQLGLSRAVEDLARRPHGIILITGATGAGKTTTFNAMIDLINRERRCKIITIEDPIEYVHRPVRSLVIQQEVGTDVKSFGEGLIHALRQDPDVIGLGEVRELETISSALIAAETGHLVLATLHTNDAVNTVSRIVDVFPGHQQQQTRYQLAQTLQGVVNQRLLPCTDRASRVLACEILIMTEAARSLVRENKLHQMERIISTGANHGMRTMETSAQDLYDKGMITYDVFASCCPKPNDAVKRLTVAKAL